MAKTEDWICENCGDIDPIELSGAREDGKPIVIHDVCGGRCYGKAVWDKMQQDNAVKKEKKETTNERGR